MLSLLGWRGWENLVQRDPVVNDLGLSNLASFRCASAGRCRTLHCLWFQLIGADVTIPDQVRGGTCHIGDVVGQGGVTVAGGVPLTKDWMSASTDLCAGDTSYCQMLK